MAERGVVFRFIPPKHFTSKDCWWLVCKGSKHHLLTTSGNTNLTLKEFPSISTTVDRLIGRRSHEAGSFCNRILYSNSARCQLRGQQVRLFQSVSTAIVPDGTFLVCMAYILQAQKAKWFQKEDNVKIETVVTVHDISAPHKYGRWAELLT